MNFCKATALAAGLFLCTAQTIAAATLKIEWDPPADGVTQGYILWGGTASLTYTHSVDVGLTTSFEISGLADGVAYYFAVQSYNAYGEMSPISMEVSGIPQSGGGNTPPMLCAGPPGVPMLVTRATSAVVRLDWAAGFGEPPSHYVLEVSSLPGGSEIARVTLEAESTTLTVPAPNGSYALKLSAINGCGTSRAAETSLTVEASLPALPGPPIGLRRQVQASAVTLQWSPPAAGAEVTRYIIEVFDTSGRHLFSVDSKTPATTFEHGAVPPGDYVVHVRAANDAGIGEPSNAVSVVVE